MGAHPGPSWLHPGSFLGGPLGRHHGVNPGPSWAHPISDGPQGFHLGLLPQSPPLVAPSWAWLASFCALLLTMGAHSRPSCGHLATSWAHPGPSFPQLGPSLARLTTSNLDVPTLQIFMFPRYILWFPRYEHTLPCAPAFAPSTAITEYSVLAILIHLGTTWCYLGPRWDPLCRILGLSWHHDAPLGSILDQDGTHCAASWPIFAPSWAIWGPVSRILGPSWGPVSRILGPSWGPVCRILGPSWAIWDPLVRP